MYESPNVMDNMPNNSTKDEIFSIEELKFWVKWLSEGKTKDIEGYQAEILKIGGPILIPHIHKLFNLAIQQGIPKPWTQSLIVPILKEGIKVIPIIIRPL
jgi:hypothetical protein